MKILVACEFSGIVREAFNSHHGNHALSCDLIPAEDGRVDYHYTGDVRDILYNGWDLMIAFPPCTHLAVSGARYFQFKQKEQKEALDFVRLLLNAPIKYIALENPVGVISTHIRKPDQIIQPWMFGHAESKKTCLWLKNLPKLIPTKFVELPHKGYWDNQTPSGQNKLTPSPTRAQDRSRTYTGVAQAMASQWTEYINYME